MVDFNYIKSKCYYVILLAVVIQLLLILLPSNTIYDPDVKSAIGRAKTDLCKKELHEVASKLIQSDISTIHLRRTCKLDRINTQRNQKVGCANNATSELLKIEYPVENVTICLDLCFGFGHSHGGFDSPTTCYCGDSSTTDQSKDLFDNDCRTAGFFMWFKVNNGIFYPPKIPPNNQSNFNDHKEVKIAFLLTLSGRRLPQVKRLIDNIYSKSHIYYVHVDKRDDYMYNELNNLYRHHDNIIMSTSRFTTIWGGTSLLRMIIDSMKNLLYLDWDYLINLSGSDFPVKSMEKLEKFLSIDTRTIYLKSHNIKGYNFIKKQGLDRNFYQCEERVWLLGRRQLPRGIIYSGGSDWFALPRDFCAFIDADASNSTGLVKPLLQIFNHTLLPAESFFHTLAINSEFCHRIRDHNLRLTNWRHKQACKCQHKDVVDWCGCSPSVYRSSDWPKLHQTNKSNVIFFARKFDPTISSSILNNVETTLLKSDQHVTHERSTRYWENVYNNDNNTNEATEALKILANQSKQNILNENYHLESASLYFDEDRFIGWLLLYCSKFRQENGICYQLLVSKVHQDKLKHSADCLNKNGRSLRVIEVNHGFDAGERMFRDYMPLNSLSDIAVYHEWTVSPNNSKTNKNLTDKLEFVWYNSDMYPALVQEVKLRRSAKRSRLTLAHRFHTPKPISSGLWTLVIKSDSRVCLKYPFVILGLTSKLGDYIDQGVFNKFYKIRGQCYIDRNTNVDQEFHPTFNDCSKENWSSYYVPIIN